MNPETTSRPTNHRTDREEVARFCEFYFKPRRHQSAPDYQAMNTVLDRATARIAELRGDPEREDEAERWRGKVQAFRSIYGFPSRIIPYQDPDLERIYTWLRHLAAKLPRRRSDPAYQFDDDMRLEYYRLQCKGRRGNGTPPASHSCRWRSRPALSANHGPSSPGRTGSE